MDDSDDIETININTMPITITPKKSTYSKQIISLASIIKNYLAINYISYEFEEKTIDDVKVCVSISKNDDDYMICIKSIQVFMEESGDVLHYILYSKNLKDIESCLMHLNYIASYYKLYNGRLISPNRINELKLQNYIIPLKESENCSICYEPSREQTICNHYLCFRCRCKCLNKNDKKCPICRDSNLDIYLINND
jgi:hypothetical protein